MEPLLPTKLHLYTPGPTEVPPSVLAAMAAPVIHHRSPQWRAIFRDMLDLLPPVFGLEPGAGHPVLMFTSSGSGAMDSAIANLVSPGDEVCVAPFGRFGERWAEIAERYGVTVHHHRTEWGSRPDPQAIAEFCAQHPDAVALYTTHSETSTGTVSDAGAIAAAVRERVGDRLLLVLDAISSLGAVPVRMREWGYDVVVAGSQKALMVPPGLAYAAVSAPALERAAGQRGSYYLDWNRINKAQSQDPPSTAFTPALTLIIGQLEALRLMHAEGLDAVYERHVKLGRATRAGVHALGLETFGPDDDSSAVVTAVRVPDGVDGGAIPTLMRDRLGVTIAGGQAHLKGEIFRLGHCGYMNELDIAVMFAALERVLVEVGAPIDPGAGVAAAQRQLVALPHG